MSLLALQFVYLLAAVGYNLVSLRLEKRGGRPLAPTNIGAALIVFAVYAGVLAAGLGGVEVLYRIGMGLFAVLLTLTGILPHLQRGPSRRYRSTAAWLGAILINLGGVLATVAGAVFGAGG